MAAQHLDSHLLTQCLRRGPDVALHAKLRGINVEAWRELVDQAIWHGVAPLLHHRLARFENLVMPPEQHIRLRDLYHHCLLKNKAILEQLSEIVRETTRVGCSVLFLKGAYLAHCVYEEAALRPTGDIDLLAPAQDAETVQRHLKALGYRYAARTEAIDYTRLHHLRPVSRVDSVNIEVHHDLAPKWAPFVHDIVGLLGRSDPHARWRSRPTSSGG